MPAKKKKNPNVSQKKARRAAPPNISAPPKISVNENNSEDLSNVITANVIKRRSNPPPLNFLARIESAPNTYREYPLGDFAKPNTHDFI